MRSVVSLVLAFTVALALAWGGAANAFAQPTDPQPATMTGCHDMPGMAPSPDSGKSPGAPAKPHATGCGTNCAVGCAVAAELAAPGAAEPVVWVSAFGLPAQTADPASAVLEAEDPPPRLLLA